VARWLPGALAVALLAGSALAFAVTERLKVEPSPIAGTQVDKVFSPVCRCPQASARITFRLRKKARVTLDMLDAGNHSVRTIARDVDRGVGRVFFRWDGRDDAGNVVPEGSYRPRVRLAEHGRTIVLPNPMRVDVTPPVIHLLSVRPNVFSPNDDRRNDRLTARYEMSERATPELLVNGRRRVVGLFKRRTGKLEWRGDGLAPPVRQGIAEISMRATDLAGNRSRSSRTVPVLVRYVKLARDRVVVAPDERFAVGVVTDQGSYRWRFAGKSGVASGRVLRLTAPSKPGSYTVFVQTPDGHADRAVVIVRGAP
jgi:flagellar hook capping protein FlgD